MQSSVYFSVSNSSIRCVQESLKHRGGKSVVMQGQESQMDETRLYLMGMHWTGWINQECI